MSIFDLTSDRRFLVVLAHPDDEVGCAALLRRARAAGCAVRMVWAHSTPIREAESRAGCALIGVDDLHFMTLPDGDVLDHLASLSAALARHAEEFVPTDVVVMHFEQGHLDHDSCCWAAHQVEADRVWEYPMYHTYRTPFQKLGRFSQREGQEVMTLTSDERRFKTALTRCYPSQTLRRNIVAYQIFRLLILQPISLAHTERFKIGLRHDFGKPNHAPRLVTKVARCSRWQRWRAALEQLGWK